MKKLSVANGAYLKDGQQKTNWVNVGVILEKNGKEFMLIDPTINFAAFPREEGKDMVMVGIFEDQQNNNQGGQQQNQNYNQNNYQPPHQQQGGYNPSFENIPVWESRVDYGSGTKVLYNNIEVIAYGIGNVPQMQNYPSQLQN